VTVLDQAIAIFSTHEQLVIRERLRRWSLANELGTRVVPNLHSERFLPPLPAMRDLLAVLLESPSDDWAVLETDYVAACRQFSCRGGTVTLATLPRWLGRAVDRSVWASYLYHHHRQGFGNCRREINRFIDKLLNQPGYSVLTSTAGQVPASRYPIWVTWEDENPNSDPFAFANSNSADHVRACLGLVSQRRGKGERVASVAALRLQSYFRAAPVSPNCRRCGKLHLLPPAPARAGRRSRLDSAVVTT
jgi:hypothetical protein